MKKVIIYGIKNIMVRREIENFLDDEYEILGYSDGHYSCDFFDGGRFFPPEELCEQEYDFIILTPQSSAAQAEVRRFLSMLGVPPDKMIRPMILDRNDQSKRYPDLIEYIDKNYQGEPNLVLGLSYSREGVCVKELDAPFFNCSSPGLDLYYNDCVYRYMERLLPARRLGAALLVIPYYYFDYDMSLSAASYTMGHTFALRQLDDWHHYQRVSIAPEYVENYRMFGKKVAGFYRISFAEKNMICRMYGEKEGSYMLDPLWFKGYEETAEENKEIFSRFYQEIESGGGRPIVVVPPFYLDGYNQVSKAALQPKKERFYSILGELEKTLGLIKAYDYFDAFSDKREFFRDITHLNAYGSAEFTRIINRDILSRELS